MTQRAAADGTVVNEARLWMAMTLEAEGVKARLNAGFQIGSLALVTLDAVLEAIAIREVVVAHQTIDLYVLAMRKIQRQRIRA
jgi:hypothetical protein